MKLYAARVFEFLFYAFNFIGISLFFSQPVKMATDDIFYPVTFMFHSYGIQIIDNYPFIQDQVEYVGLLFILIGVLMVFRSLSLRSSLHILEINALCEKLKNESIQGG